MESKKIITTEELSFWYKNILTETNLIINGPVKGTMFLGSNATKIWRNIQLQFTLNVIRKFSMKVNEVIFPTLIPKKMIEEEKDHIEGFSAELWETSRKESKNQLVLRPTSEVLFNTYFAKQNLSYQDMPIGYYQWANVFRIEENVKILLRTSEFFWQEGHTFHTTEEEALEKTNEILNLYISFFNKILLLPTFYGEKTKIEKFAGAKRTYGIETIMKDGQAIQIGTSHNLSNNFTKIFNGNFITSNNLQKFAYGSSWGFSTRSMGAMLLMHGDENGLVLPSKLAPTQLVILVFDYKKWPSNNQQKLITLVNNSKYKIKIIYVKKNSGPLKWKEIKLGIPLIMNLGKRDFDSDKNSIILRTNLNERSIIDNLFKISVNDFDKNIEQVLAINDKKIYEKALSYWENKIVLVETLDDLKSEIIEKNKPAMAYINLTSEEERLMKKEFGFSIRVILDKNKKGPCVITKKEGGKLALIARAY